MLSIEDVMGAQCGTGRQPDDAKLRELILYIAWTCEDDPSFGATKLNKLLFFADFRAYRYLGHAITSQEYQALTQGPAPRGMLPIRQQLIEEQALVIRERDFYGKRQQQPIALRSPDLSAFSAEEIAVVESVIREWWGRTATEMSRASHEFIGWRLATEGETIPYEVSLVESYEPTPEEVAIARSLEAIARDSLEALRD